MSVLIVGAGPAGLAVAATLGRAGIPYRVLEKSAGIGGAYAQVDPSMALLTPRKLTGLPFAETREPGPISAGQYLDYLKGYQRALKIPVEHGVAVARVEANREEYLVTDTQGREYRARKVVIATGSFGFPKPWPMDPARSPGTAFLQAGDWRAIRELSAGNVLIVGSGIFAAELAVSLSEKFKVYLAARGKLRFLPVRWLGFPIHQWLLPFERLPKFLFPLFCGGWIKEWLIDVGLGAAVRTGKVALCGPEFRIEEQPMRAVINATGYRFDTSILPVDVARRGTGELKTCRNQSRSHPGLYVLGAHCSGGIDSKYLRGIHRDAIRIARSIQRDLIG